MKGGGIRNPLLVGALLGVLMFSPATVAFARVVADDGPPGARAPDQTPHWPQVDPDFLARHEPPRLESVEPVGETVPVNSAIVLSFNQPMSHMSVESSFAIQPGLDGSLTWVDDFTLRFQPIRLARGTTYEVQVGGRSARNRVLTGESSWRFTTRAGPPIALAPGPGAIRVPILMYHYIRINPDPADQLGFNLSVTPSDFAAQMDWLARSGYHAITFRDLEGYLTGASGLPSRPVILTFDDGYSDFYTTALPILVKYDFKAVSYVVSGFVGRPGYMTAVQIREVDRAGVEIGSHTVNHADLTMQSPGALRYQLTASRQSLEQLVGHPVVSFCYPSGRFNGYVAASVQAAGYRDATTTQFGAYRAFAGRYTWGRVRISGGASLARFAADVGSAS